MKHSVIRCVTIVVLIGSLISSVGQAYERQPNWIQLESQSWGLAPFSTARVSVVNIVLLDGSVRTNNPLIFRVQLLNKEGEVVAKSDEISVEPGKIRFWDAPYEQIGGVRESNGRLQLRARVEFKKGSFDSNRPPTATLEIFDSTTGATKIIFYNPYITIDFPDPVPPRDNNL